MLAVKSVSWRAKYHLKDLENRERERKRKLDGEREREREREREGGEEDEDEVAAAKISTRHQLEVENVEIIASGR